MLMLAGTGLVGGLTAGEPAYAAGSSESRARASFLWYEWYRSRPDLRPPRVRVLTRTPGTAPGYVFLAAVPGGPQRGPMIVDDRGRLVWFKALRAGVVAADLRVQTYRGRPVLTWWQGRFNPGGYGCGVGVIADTSYRTVATVRPRTQGRYCPDLHEFLLTDRGTAVMMFYRRARVAGRTVLDGIVEEVDVATGRVLFRWSAARHISLSESYVPAFKNRLRPWDFIHLNSVDVDSQGNYLVSGRHTWAIYKLKPNGDVVWRLGGKRSTFPIPADARFGWQHDARFGPNGTITLFDNAAGSGGAVVRRFSSAFVLQVDEATRRVSVLRSFHHPGRVLARSQGNLQPLPNGNHFVGWGQSAKASEFGADGRVLFELQLSPDWGSYRAYRYPWTGRPAERPRIAAVRSSQGTFVYMSWNGSTELASWRVLAGNRLGAMRTVGTHASSGFQTTKVVHTSARLIAAQAVNSSGQVLATSAAVRR